MSETTLEKTNNPTGWLRQLDGLLRGEATRLSALRRGTIEISPDGLTVVIIALGLLYGFCMGCYAMFKRGDLSEHILQLIATTGKVPILFLLTLVVTFPSLYVFNALVGSRLTLLSVLRLIIAAMAVMLAVLASFGPIVAFFSISTTSYPFMLLLNVAIFSVSGFLGLKFLLLTLHRLSIIQNETPQLDEYEEPTYPAMNADTASLVPASAMANAATVAVPPMKTSGALDHLDDRVLGRDVKAVFRIWIVVFGLVGGQMSWVLRPFVGHPGQSFEWLRILNADGRDSNFFEAVFRALFSFLS